MVIVQHSYKDGIKLPSFVCRGLITSIEEENGTYYIFLVDCGISIKLTREKFHMLPHDLIPDKYLMKTVGVCGILPICMRKNGCSNLNSRNTMV